MGEQQIQEKSCGIYCIENTVNERKYIGLSRDIKRRWNEHTSKLNKHTHPNQYLQSAWDNNCIKHAADKYGINRGSISSCIKGRLKSAGKHPITGEKLTWELVEK